MYSTLQDLNDLQTMTVLLELSDDNDVGSFVITAPYNAPYLVVTKAIADADTIINSYLSGRYSLPIPAPIPETVKQISANLALCNLYDRRRDMDVPEGIKQRRDRQMKLLTDIKKELASIPELEVGDVKISPAAFLVSKTDADQFFSDDLLNMM